MSKITGACSNGIMKLWCGKHGTGMGKAVYLMWISLGKDAVVAGGEQASLSKVQRPWKNLGR